MDKNRMAELICASAHELIDNAEDIARDADNCTDMDIWIRFNGNGIPEIEINKTYIAKRVLQVYTT